MTIQEPIARPLTARDPRLAPWRSFLLAHARVSRRLDEELRAEHDVSFAEYDALLDDRPGTGPQGPDGFAGGASPPEQERCSRGWSIDWSTTGSSSAAPCTTDARGAERS
jgi:hypothetical protein